MGEKIEVSVVIPAYNEEKSLPKLVERIVQTFAGKHLAGEIIIVDDGSMDTTAKVAEELSERDTNIKFLHHKRRMGKTAALHTGFERAEGDIIVMMDADLQYAPEDLTQLLAKIREGYDFVNGWRKNRKDSILRKIPSSIYNFVSRVAFGVHLHDFNSGFKAFRKDVVADLSLREGQHRFFVNLAHYKGYRVGEVEIQHFPRKEGKTKYGFSRMFWGFFDLIALRLQLAFTDRPMALFGLSGIILTAMGFITGSYVVALRILYNESFQEHFALLLLTSVVIVAGIQTFLFGFLAEMIADLRSEQRKKP